LIHSRFWVQDIVHQSTPLLEYFAGGVQGSYVTVSMHDALPDSLIGFGSISLKIWKQNQCFFDLDLWSWRDGAISMSALLITGLSLFG